MSAKGILKHGMKMKLPQYDPAQTVTMERLYEIFETGARSRRSWMQGCLADVVYLFPDLSQAAEAQYNRGGAPRDP